MTLARKGLVIILLHKCGLEMIKGPDIQVAEYHHQQQVEMGPIAE